MRCRLLSAILCSTLISSVGFAQELSHFDISGNLSFDGATLPSAPGASTQVRAIGWQTSGVTRLNRWFALTSQFGGSSASADAIQLIGYTGPGTVRHYSMLAGPRITLASHSRFNPFIEGLVGADRASTDLISNGVSVTGRQIQVAYAIGGGAQIELSRHFGLNFQTQYFTTQDSLAFTGWQPAHLQFSTGIVIRMFGRTPQVAQERSIPNPTATASAKSEPAAEAENREVETPVNTVMTVRPASADLMVRAPVEPQTIPISPTQIPTIQQPMITPEVASSVAAAVIEPVATAKAVITPSPVVTPTSQPVAVVPMSQVLTPAPRPAEIGAQTSTSPVAQQVLSPAPRPAAVSTPIAAPQTVVQAQAEAPPVSLGEYARRLREKKQQQNH